MEKNHKKRVMFVGSHAGTVMIAVLEEIKKRSKNWEIHIVGPKYSFEKSRVPSLEKSYLGKNDVFYHQLDSGKFVRKVSLRQFLTVMKIFLGFISSFLLLVKTRPRVVISFGGYLGFPLSFNAWLLGIPVVLHEQITGLGLANRLSSFFARKVAVSRKEGLSFVSKKKGILVGNPVRNSILKVSKKTHIAKTPQIFVFTGSRGSQTVNEIIGKVLVNLLKEHKIIHLTGKPDFLKFKKIKSTLKSDLQRNYRIYDFILPDAVAKLYETSDILICRSGANTVSEILIVKRPAILIPISWSTFNEQNKNADFAKDFGIARVITENNLTEEKLLSEISFIEKNWGNIVNKVISKKSPDLQASGRLVDIIEEYV